MNAIKNNPYRILGLFGNSSEKELQKQIATIKRFAEVGKTKTFDYDFPFFGEVVRSTEKVQEAASKIEQAKNKVHYALFWFLNTGHIDEAALNNLKDGHIEKAIEIWEKLLKDSTVTAKNFAAINNISTLQLGLVSYNGSFNLEKFSEAIDLKAKIILSEVFNNFVAAVIGDGVSINRDIILKEFADEILQIVKPYLNKPNGIKPSQIVKAFNSFPNEIKQYISGKFTDRPLNNIENQIELTKQKRNDNPSDAEEYGEELYKNTKEDLVFLKNVWGANNVQYQMIANKLANEILQCAIDFFNVHQKKNDIDPGDAACIVVKLAKDISPNGQVRNRIDENLKNIEEWIAEKPYRDKQNIVRDDLKFITDKLEKFQSLDDTISNAINFANSCKPRLDNMKLKLGVHDELYSKISTAVVSNALGMIVSTVNNAMEKRNNYVKYLNYQNDPFSRLSIPSFSRNSLFDGLGSLRDEIPYAPEYSLEELKNVISEAWGAIVSLGVFDMSNKQREHYNKNKNTLKDLFKQLNSGIIFFGDTPIQKWILWVVGIGLYILIVSIFE
ncbi:MAG: hypothetical protein KatS3mg032_2111 [Cyclobacteriaceae bacterium]|nr:MAG: hypothetical protein KatS3mg032_2111 [Cyclobacteriaceae bacterium]